MKTKTEQILAVMNVLSWILYIGLMIQAGAMLIAYGVSTVNPIASKDLYKGLNLYDLRQADFLQYTITMAFKIALIVIKCHVAYLVTRILSKIKLESPFTIEVSRLLEKISYFILVLWCTAMLYSGYVAWLMKRIEGVQEQPVSGEFIFLAGVLFVFAQIFKKGVELQSENDLTV